MRQFLTQIYVRNIRNLAQAYHTIPYISHSPYIYIIAAYTNVMYCTVILLYLALLVHCTGLCKIGHFITFAHKFTRCWPIFWMLMSWKVKHTIPH